MQKTFTRTLMGVADAENYHGMTHVTHIAVGELGNEDTFEFHGKVWAIYGWNRPGTHVYAKTGDGDHLTIPNEEVVEVDKYI